MAKEKQKNQIKPETRNKKLETKYITTHGRRKEAVARVRLFTGKGEILVNQKPIEQYFPSEVSKIQWQKPFSLTKSDGQYYATIKVNGSGKSHLLDAILNKKVILEGLEKPNVVLFNNETFKMDPEIEINAAQGQDIKSIAEEELGALLRRR